MFLCLFGFVALGVDDTRMDLFDEGSSRTVPTTPLLVIPPSKYFHII